MKPISRESRATVWFAAVEHLLSLAPHPEYNLILEVREPMRRDPIDARIEDELDAMLRAAEVNPLSTVAGTIFPASAYRQHGPRGVYEVYPKEEYPEIESDLEWGAYAHRLVCRLGPDGSLINPLEMCIDKMKAELKTPGPKRACYEISISEGALDLPLYDTVADDSRHLGGPCLSHVSLKIRDRKELLLTALYRSHYYVTKTLGNLLGLAQLQAFVCEQTSLKPGPLVCISTFAKLDSGKGYNLSAMREFVGRIRSNATAAQLSDLNDVQMSAS